MSLLLRAENAAVAIVLLAAYQMIGGDWMLFALLVLAPDLSMLGYLGGPRLGAWCYNAAHSWIAAALLWVAAMAFGSHLLQELALILGAHIAIDRALGFGLKFESGFQDTHLGRIGGRGRDR